MKKVNHERHVCGSRFVPCDGDVEAASITELDLERFWKKVKVCTPEECWPWTGRTDRDGYGVFRVHGRDLRAHRVAYGSKSRDRPPLVMHSCDNRACCNPDHLKAGTHRENMRDMTRKDRQAKGSRNGRSKLTENEVRSIKLDLFIRVPQATLARKFGVSRSVLRDIKRKKTWGHVKMFTEEECNRLIDDILRS